MLDPYQNTICDDGTEAGGAATAEINSRCDAMEAMLLKGRKRQKRSERYQAALETRIEGVEKELAQLKSDHVQLISYLDEWLRYQEKNPWWRGLFKTSMPALIGLAGTVLRGKFQPKPYVLPTRGQPLYLLDSRDDRK